MLLKSSFQRRKLRLRKIGKDFITIFGPELATKLFSFQIFFLCSRTLCISGNESISGISEIGIKRFIMWGRGRKEKRYIPRLQEEVC